MAALPTADRIACRKEIAAIYSRNRSAFPITRAELDQLIADTDTWQDGKAAEYNSALTASIRNKINASDKNLIFTIVSKKRYGGVI